MVNVAAGSNYRTFSTVRRAVCSTVLLVVRALMGQLNGRGPSSGTGGLRCGVDDMVVCCRGQGGGVSLWRLVTFHAVVLYVCCVVSCSRTSTWSTVVRLL